MTKYHVTLTARVSMRVPIDADTVPKAVAEAMKLAGLGGGFVDYGQWAPECVHDDDGRVYDIKGNPVWTDTHCPRCAGDGWVDKPFAEVCGTCTGSGRTRATRHGDTLT